jgi:hypothetical protein
MFINWFKKQPKEDKAREPEIKDDMELSLWEIKEEYDLPTEEIVNVVYSKRSNFSAMRAAIRKLNKEKK